MIKKIVHDPGFLGQVSQVASEKDRAIIQDLVDTFLAHQDNCIGMAANMIGHLKRMIVLSIGPIPYVMINPVITKKAVPYEATEGCLALLGEERPVKRYDIITVEFLDRNFKKQKQEFKGLIAQIIQHEIDHCNGILI